MQVIVTDEKGTTSIDLISNQMGSYFGASLAACDVDGDGVDELLVGAPQRRGPLADQGRVYVYRINIRTQNAVKHEQIVIKDILNFCFKSTN